MRTLDEVYREVINSNPNTEKYPNRAFLPAPTSKKSYLEFAIEIHRNEVLQNQAEAIEVLTEVLKSVFGYCEDDSRPAFFEKMCMLMGSFPDGTISKRSIKSGS